jgi:4'-phosphopantetheinyl transferase
MSPPVVSRSSPDAPLALDANEVHIWHAALNQPAETINRLSHSLTPDETTRAARFRFQKDRDHFIVARGVLRALLGRYLNAAPADLRFSYTHYGKPYLAGPFHHTDLCFNVSHSHERVLYAFTRGREIGVDIEHIRPDVVTEQIAERFFSALEVASLRSLPAVTQPQGFFNCWTRKEAYIKARGEGLSLPLDQFDVSLLPDEPVALLATRDDPAEALRWSLHELPTDEGYIAALAVAGYDLKIEHRNWPIP